MLTNGGDQTKDQVILHVDSPTNPYQVAVLSERVVMVLLVWCRKPYQSLPINRSGSPTILECYYQHLPAAVLNTHMISTVIFYMVIVGLLAYASYLKHQLKK